MSRLPIRLTLIRTRSNPPRNLHCRTRKRNKSAGHNNAAGTHRSRVILPGRSTAVPPESAVVSTGMAAIDGAALPCSERRSSLTEQVQVPCQGQRCTYAPLAGGKFIACEGERQPRLLTPELAAAPARQLRFLVRLAQSKDGVRPVTASMPFFRMYGWTGRIAGTSSQRRSRCRRRSSSASPSSKAVRACSIV